jgi:hypothetical protein
LGLDRGGSYPHEGNLWFWFLVVVEKMSLASLNALSEFRGWEIQELPSPQQRYVEVWLSWSGPGFVSLPVPIVVKA